MKTTVSQFYDQNPDNEWNRLIRSPYRRIEFEIVFHFLQTLLPREGMILDFGGGPGRYSLALTKQGHRVTLIDLSEKHIALAQQKIAGLGSQKHLLEAYVGDQNTLRTIPDKTYDAVLCMGPLYHLTSEKDRDFCMRECARILRPNGYLFLTAYPRLSYLLDSIRSRAFASLQRNGYNAIHTILKQGHSADADLPDTYFCQVEEIPKWFDRSGLAFVTMASLHGPVSFMDDKIEPIAKNPHAWNELIQLLIETCKEPQALATAEYVLGIGQKSP